MKKKKWQSFVVMVLVIIALGLLSGIVVYNIQGNNIKNSISIIANNITNLNKDYIIKDLVVSSILLITSFFVIGLPLSLAYLFYEGVKLGFLIAVFNATLHFKGIINLLIFLLINRLIPLILLIFLIRKIINISRLVIGLFIYKNDSNILNKVIFNFKNALFIIFLIFIVNIIIHFLSPIILEFFHIY